MEHALSLSFIEKDADASSCLWQAVVTPGEEHWLRWSPPAASLLLSPESQPEGGNDMEDLQLLSLSEVLQVLAMNEEPPEEGSSTSQLGPPPSTDMFLCFEVLQEALFAVKDMRLPPRPGAPSVPRILLARHSTEKNLEWNPFPRRKMCILETGDCLGFEFSIEAGTTFVLKYQYQEKSKNATNRMEIVGLIEEGEHDKHRLSSPRTTTDRDDDADQEPKTIFFEDKDDDDEEDDDDDTIPPPSPTGATETAPPISGLLTQGNPASQQPDSSTPITAAVLTQDNPASQQPDCNIPITAAAESACDNSKEVSPVRTIQNGIPLTRTKEGFIVADARDFSPTLCGSTDDGENNQDDTTRKQQVHAENQIKNPNSTVGKVEEKKTRANEVSLPNDGRDEEAIPSEEDDGQPQVAPKLDVNASEPLPGTSQDEETEIIVPTPVNRGTKNGDFGASISPSNDAVGHEEVTPAISNKSSRLGAAATPEAATQTTDILPAEPLEVPQIDEQNEHSDSRKRKEREGIEETPQPELRRRRGATPAAPPSSRRRTPSSPDASAICIMTTGVELTQSDKQAITRLGGRLIATVEEAHNATHVIATNGESRLRRTPKLMIAMNVTKNIVSLEWLKKSAKLRRFVPTTSYLVLDDEDAEATYNFSMRQSIIRSETMRKSGKLLLDGYVLVPCPGVTGSKSRDNRTPPDDEFRLIVESAGGRWASSRDVDESTEDIVIVLTSKVSREAAKQLRNAPIAKLVAAGAKAISTEELFHAIMTQQLDV